MVERNVKGGNREEKGRATGGRGCFKGDVEKANCHENGNFEDFLFDIRGFF